MHVGEAKGTISFDHYSTSLMTMHLLQVARILHVTTVDFGNFCRALFFGDRQDNPKKNCECLIASESIISARYWGYY